MNRLLSAARSASGLVAINAGLLAALALVVFVPPAGTNAQPAAAAPGAAVNRARGTYTMVAGRVQGQVESAIYIVDAANQEMIAMKWDRSRKQLKGLGYQDLAPGRRGPVNPNQNPAR